MTKITKRGKIAAGVTGALLLVLVPGLGPNAGPHEADPRPTQSQR